MVLGVSSEMSITTKIINTLDEVNIDSKGQNWGDSGWTKEIKSRICKLGKEEYRYWVYASGTDGSADEGEWLYDVTWLNYSGSRLLDTELVLESEWNMNGIDSDFQKLLVAKADRKVMIFQQRNTQQAKEKFIDLIEQISRYSKTTIGESYLFSCWLMDKNEFLHREYIHK